MILINGKAFAENEGEFTNSLFEPINGQTCAGYSRRTLRTVKLFNVQNELIGVINRHGVLCNALKVRGRYWYSFADIDEIGEVVDHNFQNDLDRIYTRKEYKNTGLEYWFR